MARCAYCGQYFMPDARVGIRQKACSRPACKKARKKDAQRTWCDKNPGYFRGRYPYVKAWRKAKRMIQDEIPRESLTWSLFCASRIRKKA